MAATHVALSRPTPCAKADLFYLVFVTGFAFLAAVAWLESNATPRQVSLKAPSIVPVALTWHASSIDKTLKDLPAVPSYRHWLGTDDRGRDVFIRWLLASWVAIHAAFLGLFFAVPLGLLLGCLPEFLRLSFIQTSIPPWGLRTTQIFAQVSSALAVLSRALPFFFLSAAVAESGVRGTFGIVGIWLVFTWPSIARQASVWTRHWSDLPFVQAATLSGVSASKLALKSLLPYLLPRLSALTPRLALESVAVVASLQYLGLGGHLGEPTLAELFMQFREYGVWTFLLPPVLSLTAIWMVLTRIDRLIQRLCYRSSHAGLIEY